MPNGFWSRTTESGHTQLDPHRVSCSYALLEFTNALKNLFWITYSDHTNNYWCSYYSIGTHTVRLIMEDQNLFIKTL